MLAHGGLGTSIGRNPDGTYNQTLTRLHNRGANPDKALIAAFGKINELADHLGVTSVVKDGACDVYRMVVKPGVSIAGNRRTRCSPRVCTSLADRRGRIGRLKRFAEAR